MKFKYQYPSCVSVIAHEVTKICISVIKCIYVHILHNKTFYTLLYIITKTEARTLFMKHHFVFSKLCNWLSKKLGCIKWFCIVIQLQEILNKSNSQPLGKDNVENENILVFLISPSWNKNYAMRKVTGKGGWKLGQ